MMKMVMLGLVIGVVTMVFMGRVMLTYYNVEPLALVSLLLGTLGAGMSAQRMLELISARKVGR